MVILKSCQLYEETFVYSAPLAGLLRKDLDDLGANELPAMGVKKLEPEPVDTGSDSRLLLSVIGSGMICLGRSEAKVLSR